MVVIVQHLSIGSQKHIDQYFHKGYLEYLKIMVLGDLDSYMQENETQSPTYTIHKNKFKVDKRLKYKS